MRKNLTFLLLATAFAFAGDQVTLKNGDRITGSVVKKDAKSLTFKSDVFGTVVVPWDQVDSLSTEKPVTVVLESGSAVQGTIQARDGKAEIRAEGTTREAPLSQVTALRDAAEQRAYERLLQPSWTELWAGAASFGFAGAQGNAETRTLTTGFNAARVTNGDKTVVYFNAVRASAVLDRATAVTAQAVRGGWGYSRNVSSRLFVNGFNDYEYDRFQDLDLRVVLGGGLGFIAWKGERGRLDLLGGAAWNREAFTPRTRAAFTRSSGEAYFGNDLNYRLNSRTAMFQNLRVFPNLSRTGELRVNFDTGANTQLTRWLSWNVAISNRYLSNPVPGRKQNDVLYSTGIGVTFAR